MSLGEKVLRLESELGSVYELVRIEMESLQAENASLRVENSQLKERLNERCADLEWKEEVSRILILQRDTLREFQRKYRRALLYADELQKRLREI
jgi:regulator of replication initiation timing